MAHARIDSSIPRHKAEGFDFPLGVYPVEPMNPIPGYTLNFESADSVGYDAVEGREIENDDDDEGPASKTPSKPGPGSRGERGDRSDDTPGMDEEEETWGQWPDRYVFDINISASRVEALCRQLFALLPGRIYPILDVMGNDAHREIDPYIAYDLVGLERFHDALRRFRAWLFEDGTVGFGAMSEEPFFYVFVDEHKIVTVRAESAMKEQVERILAAFDLREVEKIAGADAAVHEHRGVLDPRVDAPDALTHDEIVEELRDQWGLTLNVDPMRNTDDDGDDLGITPWRCVVRVFDEHGSVRYAEVLLTAPHLQAAGDMAIAAVEHLDPALSPETPQDDQDPSDFDVLWADRTAEEDLLAMLGDKTTQLDLKHGSTIAARWLA